MQNLILLATERWILLVLLTNCLHDAEGCHNNRRATFENPKKKGWDDSSSKNAGADRQSVDTEIVVVGLIHANGLNWPEDNQWDVVDAGREDNK